MPKPTSGEALREWVSTYNPEALFADGFDAAILGIAERCSQPALVVYDAEACIKILMARNKCSYDEAWEYFEFNTLGAWVGDHTPLFLTFKRPGGIERVRTTRPRRAAQSP